MTLPTSPPPPNLSARQSHPLRPGIPWNQAPVWPSAQSAYGQTGATYRGEPGVASTPAERTGWPGGARLGTGLEPVTGEGGPSVPGVGSRVADVLGSVVAWLALGVGLAAGCQAVGWFLS